MTASSSGQPLDWERVSALVADALAMADPAEREAFLQQQADQDPALLAEVRSLLTAEQCTLPLDTAVAGSAVQAALSTPRAAAGYPAEPAAENRLGQRLGPWRLVRVIARGGMGSVYEAERDDGAYQARVAVKLLNRPLLRSDPQWLERFQAERQILADLHHPNITHLLDAGSHEDGAPYLVMELVDGQAIDRYCQEQRLGLRARLRLFQTVCEAVHFAHQRLIVHCDLKPENILVDRDGRVKLLDFGIARLLQQVGRETNPAQARALTPAYSSPEQLRGEGVSTASDIYALGVVLYRLLTGVHPFRNSRSSISALAREISETLPTPPSRCPREASALPMGTRLPLELDAIVLKAMAPAPESRYRSAIELAEDLGRLLEDRPVQAHHGGRVYRFGKFLRRHRWSSAFAALAVLGLLGGVLLATQQAQLARAAQARAERHFAAVRSVVGDVLFKTHDELQRIPGSTAVRAQLLERATKYLQALASDPAALHDPSFAAELARGWLRLAILQGETAAGGSSDDAAAAQLSFAHALDAIEQAAQARPQDPGLAADRIRILHIAGRFAATRGEPATARTRLDRALQLGEAMLVSAPDPVAMDAASRKTWRRLQLELASALVSHSFYIRGATPEDSARYRRHGQRAFELLERLAASAQNEEERQAVVEFELYALGTLAQPMHTGPDGRVDWPAALAMAERAFRLAESRQQAAPTDPKRLRELSVAAGDVAAAAAELKRWPQALRMRRLQVELNEAMLASDAADHGARAILYSNLASLAESEWHSGDLAASLAAAQKAQQHWQTLSEPARETFDVVSGRMALAAIEARAHALRAAQTEGPGLPRASARQRELWCQEALAAYEQVKALQGRWESFYQRSLAEELAAIRADMSACRAFLPHFPDR